MLIMKIITNNNNNVIIINKDKDNKKILVIIMVIIISVHPLQQHYTPPTLSFLVQNPCPEDYRLGDDLRKKKPSVRDGGCRTLRRK